MDVYEVFMVFGQRVQTHRALDAARVARIERHGSAKRCSGKGFGDRPARMRGWLGLLPRAVLSRQARTSDRTHHEGPTTNGNRCLCHVRLLSG
jgi:hypothetical protein